MISSTHFPVSSAESKFLQHREESQGSSPLKGRVSLNLRWEQVLAISIAVMLVFLPFFAAAVAPVSSCTSRGIVQIRDQHPVLLLQSKIQERGGLSFLHASKPLHISQENPEQFFEDCLLSAARFLELGDKEVVPNSRWFFYRLARLNLEQAQRTNFPHKECADEIEVYRQETVLDEVKVRTQIAKEAQSPDEKIAILSEALRDLNLYPELPGYFAGTHGYQKVASKEGAVLWEMMSQAFSERPPHEKIPENTIFARPQPLLPISSIHAAARSVTHQLNCLDIGDFSKEKRKALAERGYNLYTQVDGSKLEGYWRVTFQNEVIQASLRLYDETGIGSFPYNEMMKTESIYASFMERAIDRFELVKFAGRRVYWLMQAAKYAPNDSQKKQNLEMATHISKALKVPDFKPENYDNSQVLPDDYLKGCVI